MSGKRLPGAFRNLKPRKRADGETVYYPASCKDPAPGYEGELVRCSEVYGGQRCWHLQGHEGAHQCQEWAESEGKKGTQWRT